MRVFEIKELLKEGKSLSDFNSIKILHSIRREENFM